MLQPREGYRTLSGRRAVVVGAGPGGLAVALLLAREGVHVTVVEKDDCVGGRTRTVTAPGGYRFDIGPTFFLYPRILADIFASCGERLEDHVRLERLDPLYHLVFEGGGEIRATSDVTRLQAEIARMAPADAANVPRYLADNRAKLEAFRPVLEQPFDSLRSLVSAPMLRALPLLRPHATVDRDLQRYFADPRVRLAFSFQTKYLGMSPFRCPSLFTILSFLEYEHGVFHPVGGCGAVSEAMAGLARRLGVDIRLGTAVDRVLFEGDRAVGVEAGGERLPADSVVVNGDFAKVVRALVPERHRPRWRDAKLDRARLSCSTFMLYLGLEGRMPEGLGHHTILLAEEYRRNIAEISTGILPRQPSLYVQHAGFTDGGMAPPGHTSLYVLVPVPNLRADIDWATVRPQYRRLVLDRLKLLGLTDIERRIRYERIVDPTDWRDAFAVNEGATFNLSHDLGQMLYFRPHNRFGRGLYLVGGGTHPGSGLPVIYEGARITARLLLEDLARQGRRSLPDLAPPLEVAPSGKAT
ncbi:phytoene desaturase [Methylobacterium sp. 4-46]|uniref:phytoene desaturase family protein n=1 Tax=unclassified Methylobacterium TaxID=2615210 RepID=UPI000165CE2A|nr:MULTISPECIES: phytoene desaturase family protein [Methylobacterium]ACA19522.1 phytoene desaturase [Methylobacterium sp. 4-46]WFT78718.1 phytoene desaturase family protein [Methylobacterium nodulans]